MDDLDIITRDGDRLTGSAAREYLDRYQAVKDAIILERAVQVLRRRYPEGLKYDVAWLEHYAGALRREAENG